MESKVKLKKDYIIEMKFDEHEISMFQATLGINSLPELVHKSFVEYSEEELSELFKSIREGLE